MTNDTFNDSVSNIEDCEFVLLVDLDTIKVELLHKLAEAFLDNLKFK